MSKLGKQVKLNSLAEDQYALLKEGNYNVIITKASEEANKRGNGRLIKLELDVLGPTNKGAKLFHRINYIHENPDAQRIGEIELRQIMEAMGKTGNDSIEDTDELLNQTFLCKVGVQDGDGQYEAQNVIKRFMKSTISNDSYVSRPAAQVSNEPSYQSPSQSQVTKPNRRPWEN